MWPLPRHTSVTLPGCSLAPAPYLGNSTQPSRSQHAGASTHAPALHQIHMAIIYLLVYLFVCFIHFQRFWSRGLPSAFLCNRPDKTYTGLVYLPPPHQAHSSPTPPNFPLLLLPISQANSQVSVCSLILFWNIDCFLKPQFPTGAYLNPQGLLVIPIDILD